MSRHLALDPRQPPVPVTMPRQGQPQDAGAAAPVDPQGFPAAGAATARVQDAPAGADQDAPAGAAAGVPAWAPGVSPEEGPGEAREAAPASRRSTRRGRGASPEGAPATGSTTARATGARPPGTPLDQPLPKLRPAARHHSGVEHKGLRRSHPPATGKATAPRGIGLSKALLALLGSALVAALAGAWAYHSWNGNRELSRSGGAAAKAPLVMLDGVADTSAIQFQAGHTAQVQVSVRNPNPQPVAVQGIEPGKVVLSEPVPQVCSAAMVKAVAEHNDLVVPPGDGLFDATIAMSAAAPPDCNGIAFSVTFVVTGTVTTP